jgi:hypothetical protein
MVESISYVHIILYYTYENNPRNSFYIFRQ